MVITRKYINIILSSLWNKANTTGKLRTLCLRERATYHVIESEYVIARRENPISYQLKHRESTPARHVVRQGCGYSYGRTSMGRGSSAERNCIHTANREPTSACEVESFKLRGCTQCLISIVFCPILKVAYRHQVLQCWELLCISKVTFKQLIISVQIGTFCLLVTDFVLISKL